MTDGVKVQKEKGKRKCCKKQKGETQQDVPTLLGC